MFNGLSKELVPRRVFQIADVLAQEGMLPFNETDAIFKFGAHGEDSWKILLQKYGHGDKSARASQLPQRAADHTPHRIVAAQQDVPVVHQETVSKTAKPLDRFLVIDRNRLLTQIPAGHHQGGEAALCK